MIKQLFSKNDRPHPRATVTDGMLVLSFPDAKEGAIWRLPVKTAEASSFQLTNDKGEIRLTMDAGGNGEAGAKVLAIYYEPQRAERALDAVMDAIIAGEPEVTSSPNQPKKKSGWIKKTAFYLGVVIIAMALGIGVVRLFGGTGGMPDMPQMAESESSGGEGGQAGVPQSVDELFGN
jgi:hypothetical protein